MSNTDASPDHYEQGKQWLATAEIEHARIGTDPKATDRALTAAQIATAHFTAASVSWGDPELMGPPLTSVPDQPELGTIQYGPWPHTPPEKT
ncbi:hypothetical protein ACWFMI_23350 [Nocardiopsis terrae]|uniref:hypothetical protein n=1 Tax=Streptomyces sp. NPDC057554 TaxID=3350538 RepID=UPI0036C380CD